MRSAMSLETAATGTLAAAVTTGAAFAIAVLGFGNAYYVSVFIPFAMLSFLAVAWFMFLRDDGLARRRRDGPRSGDEAAPRPAEPQMVSGIGSADCPHAGAEPLSSGLDASMYAPLDGAIVSRRQKSADGLALGEGVSAKRGGLNAKAALVLAALELGILAAALYAVAGVGARYYL